MNSPTLKQLRYVLALAEHGHFGRAAEASHVTQPGLSQQVAQVEALCGTPLFERLGRMVRPTPFGEDFLARARRVVEESEALANFIHTRRGRPQRPLRFGLIPTVAPYLLPDIFPAVAAAMPDLHLTVREDRTDALLARLADGSLDLALIATEPRAGGPELTQAPLFADPFVLATSMADPLGGPVPLEAIDRRRMLLLDEGHCLRDQAIAACGLAPEEAGHSFAATSLSTIVEFVANDQGVTLLPAIALRKEAAGDRIRIRPLLSPGAQRLLSLVWRKSTPYAQLFHELAAIIRATHQDSHCAIDGQASAV